MASLNTAQLCRTSAHFLWTVHVSANAGVIVCGCFGEKFVLAQLQ
jgi:hypothetical protein